MFEVGQFYLWGGHVVTAYFKPETNQEQSEHVENGFMMVYGNKTIEYQKDVITPDSGCRCECIQLNPLTFKVEKVISPLLEEEIKYKQAEVVKTVLRNLGCGTSDLDVQAIINVAIPHNLRDMPVSEDVVLHTLNEYLQSEINSPYTGSCMGYSDYENTLASVLTVLFGHKVAYALMKMKDKRTVDVKYFGNKFVAYYNEQEFESYLNSISSLVGVRTSAADSMLQDILSSVRSGTNKTADADDVITFTAWYQALTAENKELLQMANPELAEAAAHNDRITMRNYGSFGLRQTMWLIISAIPLSCDRTIADFYNWMYQHISAEGWNRLSIEFKDLFTAVCNRKSFMGDDNFLAEMRDKVGMAMAVLEKYYNRNGDYCQ